MNAARTGALASLVASLFATASCGNGAAKTPDVDTKTQTVKCAGINECAGTGSCAGTLADGGTNSCAGQNSCKGQGWVEVPSESDCTTKGGTVLR